MGDAARIIVHNTDVVLALLPRFIEQCLRVCNFPSGSVRRYAYAMSSPAYTRWETIASVVGVITAIPLIITLVVMYLPTRKVAGLFTVLNDTDDLLDDLLEEGILGQHHIEIFREHLAQ